MHKNIADFALRHVFVHIELLDDHAKVTEGEKIVVPTHEGNPMRGVFDGGDPGF